MAFCINCGCELPDGAKFCMNCGTENAAVASQTPPPEPDPVPAPAPEPEAEPSPEPESVQPEPVIKPVQQPSQQFTQVNSPDVDEDLDMEGPPIVGSYTIPESTKINTGGKRSVIIAAAAGGIALIAVIVCAIIFIPRLFGSSEIKGEGDALTKLLDNTAATHYAGGTSEPSSPSNDMAPAEDEKPETGETSDSGNGEEVLCQGYIYMTIPDGFELNSGENEMRSVDNNRCKISIGHKTKTGDIDSARAAAEDDVNFYVSNGKDAGDYYITDDITAGGRTWVVEHFPWDGEDHSAKFFTDIDDKYLFEVDTFLMNEEDDEVIRFLESLHFEDGDFGDLRSAWLDSNR